MQLLSSDTVLIHSGNNAVNSVVTVQLSTAPGSPSQLSSATPTVIDRKIVDAKKQKLALRESQSHGTLHSDHDLDSDNSTPSSHSDHDCAQVGQKRTQGRRSVQASDSWKKQKMLRDQAHEGSFRVIDSKLRAFQKKILADDKHATFDGNNILRVRCSACSTWLKMRVPYDTKHWKSHRSTKGCKASVASGVSTLSIWALLAKPQARTPAMAGQIGPARLSLQPSLTPTHTTMKVLKVPCPGLTRESDLRIARYLRRTSTPGGGAPSRIKIAQTLFKLSTKKSACWKQLSSEQQHMVLCREPGLYHWVNRRDVGSASIVQITCVCTRIPTGPTNRQLSINCDFCCLLWFAIFNRHDGASESWGCDEETRLGDEGRSEV